MSLGSLSIGRVQELNGRQIDIYEAGFNDGTDPVVGALFPRAGRPARRACRTGVVPVACSWGPIQMATFLHRRRSPLVEVSCKVSQVDVLLRLLAGLDPQDREPDLARQRFPQEFLNGQMREIIGYDALKRNCRPAVILDLEHKKGGRAADLHVVIGHAPDFGHRSRHLARTKNRGGHEIWGQRFARNSLLYPLTITLSAGVSERVEVRHHVRGRRRYNALIENVAQESIEDRRMAELRQRGSWQKSEITLC
jgi:hypothetical protein